MMKRVLASGLLCAVLVLVGCAAEGPTSLVSPAEARQIGYAPLWAGALDIPASQTIAHTLLTEDLLLTVEEPDGVVTAVNLRDGSVRWRKQINNGKDTVLGIARKGSTILVNSEAQIYQIAADTGTITQIHTLAQAVMTGPVVWEDFAIFGGTSGTIFAQDLTAGYAKWQYQLTAGILQRPALIGNTVFAADENGVVVMLGAAKGEPLWRRRPCDGLSGQPAVTGLGVFFPTIENKLFAIQRAGGQDRWVKFFPSRLMRGPILMDTLLLQKLEGNIWVALEAPTGKELWRCQGNIHTVFRGKNGLMLVTPEEIRTVEPATGKVLHVTPTLRTQAVFALPGNSLVLLGTDGATLRLDPVE